MDPKQVDALLGVMGLAPSRWTLAAEVEREAREAERRERRTRWLKGKARRKDLRYGTSARLRRERKRKAHAAVNGLKGSHGPTGAGKGIGLRRAKAKWLERGALKRFRPLAEVQAARKAVWEMLRAQGGEMAFSEMVQAGAGKRWLASDLKWLQQVGAIESRWIEGDRSPLKRARVQRWRAIGDKALLYEPGPLQAGLYAWQAWAEVMNG